EPRPAAAVVAGAARHEAAHRVADEHDLLDRHGPRLHRLLEQPGEPPAVVRDVEPGVVAEVERRVAELLLEARAVGAAPEQRPGVVGLAQAVHEHGDPWRIAAAA